MTDKPTRIGRPKKAPSELRTERLSGIRLTTAEREYVAVLADRAGLDVMEFCRRAILGQRIVPARRKVRADVQLADELNRIGTNLNQIAHAANMGRTLSDKLEVSLSELLAALARMEPDE